MAVPDAYLDERWARACDAVEAGEIYAAKVVPGGGGSSGSPLICYTTDFRNEADVLRAGLALRRRLGATTKLMYKPDVFTIAGVRCPEALETIGPRGGRKKILMCPYRLRPVEADDASEPGAASLHVVKPSLERALELATERWALQSYSDDEDGVDDGDGAGEGRKVGGGRPRGGDASTSEAADPDPGPRAAAAEAAIVALGGGRRRWDGGRAHRDRLMTTCTGRDAGVSWERAGWPSERDEGENAIEWDERRRESPNRVAPGPTTSYESSCNKHARRKRISLEARRAGRARHAARRARSPRRITSWPGQRGRVNIHSLWIGPVGRCPHLPARRRAMRALAPSVPAHLAARRAVHSPRLAPALPRLRAPERLRADRPPLRR